MSTRAPDYHEYPDRKTGLPARIEFRDKNGHRLGVGEVVSIPGRFEVFRDVHLCREHLYVTDRATLRHLGEAILAIADAADAGVRDRLEATLESTE